MTSASALAAGRRAMQAQMVDTCVINKMVKSDTLDENTNKFPIVPVLVYSGPCKFTVEALQVRDVDSQGQDFAVAGGVLRIPVDAPGSAQVSKDHVATITLAAADTSVIKAVVQSSHAQSFATARRIPVTITT